MVAPFPILKLGALAIRQISKPLAKRIQARAKKSPILRTYLCMPLAQLYHRMEVTIKMKLINVRKPKEIVKLKEADAIELGAELLGEFIIFAVAAATITLEYIRQSKSKSKESLQTEERWKNVESRLKELDFQADKINAQIRHLTRVIASIKTNDKKENRKNINNNNSMQEDVSLIGQAIDKAELILGIKSI